MDRIHAYLLKQTVDNRLEIISGTGSSRRRRRRRQDPFFTHMIDRTGQGCKALSSSSSSCGKKISPVRFQRRDMLCHGCESFSPTSTGPWSVLHASDITLPMQDQICEDQLRNTGRSLVFSEISRPIQDP